MTKSLINIYELIDPRTNLPRYIGYTKHSISKRLNKHLGDRGKTHKVNWIKSLKNNNLIPISNLIEQVPDGEHKFWEKYWISQYKAWGFDLVNSTTGGEGVDDPSGEVARKISQAQKGVPDKHITSKETRNKRRLARLGKKASLESRMKMSMSQKSLGKINSKETRLKISQTKKGKTTRVPGSFTHSIETKKLISELQLGKKLEEIHKMNISRGSKRAWEEGRRNRIFSEEHKAHMRKPHSVRKIKVVDQLSSELIFNNIYELLSSIPSFSQYKRASIYNACRIEAMCNGYRLFYI